MLVCLYGWRVHGVSRPLILNYELLYNVQVKQMSFKIMEIVLLLQSIFPAWPTSIWYILYITINWNCYYIHFISGKNTNKQVVSLWRVTNQQAGWSKKRHFIHKYAASHCEMKHQHYDSGWTKLSMNTIRIQRGPVSYNRGIIGLKSPHWHSLNFSSGAAAVHT